MQAVTLAAAAASVKPMRHDIGHPSNMPIPPPRRKKSFNNLHQQGTNGSLDELNNFRTPVNWKPVVNPNNTFVQGLQASASDAYINESIAPSNVPPQAASASNSMYTQWPPMQRSFNVTPAMYASATELSNPMVAGESITVPSVAPMTATVTAASIIPESVDSASNSNSNSKASSTIRKRTNSLSRRRNNSLQDLRREDPRYATMVPFSYIGGPQLPPPPPGHPYSQYPYNPYAHPYAYWDAYGANELDMNDESSSESLDDEEEPILVRRSSQPVQSGRRSASGSRRSSSRTRRSSSRSRIVDPYATLGRSVSSYQLPPPPQVWPGYPPPPPPPVHPYYGYPPNYPGYYGSYVHSLASSPPGSIRSSSMVRKRSLDNFSTASSIRASDTGHRSTNNNSNHRSNARQSLDRINYQRVTNSRNGKAVSASGKTGSIRSLTSSRFGDTDSDDLLDAEDFYSASDDGADVGNNAHATTESKAHHKQQQRTTSATGSKGKRLGNLVKDTQGTSKFNGHRVSGRGRNASNGQVNEYEDIDDDDGNSNMDSTTNNENGLSGQWSCKHCTYINSIENAICEVCAKSNPRKFKQVSTSVSPNEQTSRQEEQVYGEQMSQLAPAPKQKSGKILSVVKAIEAKVKQTQGELHYKLLSRNQLLGQRKESTAKSVTKEAKRNQDNASNRKEDKDRDEEDEDEDEDDEEQPLKVLTLTDDLVISDELVREQIEIENELRRRRENEKRIERQNKRIELERQLKVREENENWTSSNLDVEDEDEDEKMANGKVNRRNEDQSKRKDVKNKNEHLDDDEIEEEEELQDDQQQQEDEEDDEADGENEERMDLMTSDFGHSSIAPSVSPAEWKRLASKKKTVKRRKVTTKSTFNSNLKTVPPAKSTLNNTSGKKDTNSSVTRGHVGRNDERTVQERPSSSKESNRKATISSSKRQSSSKNLANKGKESFSVQVSVTEPSKKQVEETLESLIASLASYKINPSQLEKVIKNVTQNDAASRSSGQSINSCPSSPSSSSSNSAGKNAKSNTTNDSLQGQVLREALLQKLLQEQLINDASINASACVNNNNNNGNCTSINGNGQTAFGPSHVAYPVSMIQPPGSNIIALHPSTLTASSHPHPHPHPWTQFAPSQQFFGDPSTTLMLMTSQMRGQRQGSIQSTGNGYYSHFTSINPYATFTPTSPASSMSTSITSTCNPVIDNGHLVAQKTAESTSEQGQKLNSKLSNTTDLIFDPTSASSSQVPSASNTTAAIEMIKILKEAKKKGFTVDEVEIALNCNSSKPIGE